MNLKHLLTKWNKEMLTWLLIDLTLNSYNETINELKTSFDKQQEVNANLTSTLITKPMGKAKH